MMEKVNSRWDSGMDIVSNEVGRSLDRGSGNWFIDSLTNKACCAWNTTLVVISRVNTHDLVLKPEGENVDGS
jgi:hypothetical protein